MSLRRVAVSSGEFQVFDSGQGWPLVFLHGFPLDHTMWKGQLERFSWNRRVIAPDLRGFGGSPMSAAGSLTHTMDQFADDVAAILDALDAGTNVDLVGLSMGGYVAFAFRRRHPTRLRSWTLCDTRAGADSPEMAKSRQDAAERLERENNCEFLADAMLPKLFAPEASPEIVAQTRQTILRTNPRAAAAAHRGMSQRLDSRSDLPKVGLPTLVVCGEHDAISPPSEMEAFAKQIPGATFALIQHAGHMAPLEQPERFNEILAKFLGA